MSAAAPSSPHRHGNDDPPRRDVVVVGGGWAGISAAVELGQRGWRVQLLEATRQLGGRARDVSLDGRQLDNGQHLLLGAYRSVLALLDRLGVAAEQVVVRRRLGLHMTSPHGLRLAMRVGAGHAPWHLVKALTTASGLGLSERLRAAAFLRALSPTAYDGHNDISVRRLLERHGQPRNVRETLWEPLCLAALNTRAEQASARLFTRVLHEALLTATDASDLLIPRTDLGAVLPKPAGAFVTRQGGTVRLARRVRSLALDERGVAGVALGNGEHLATRHVVVAVGAVDAARLLRPHAPLTALAQRIDALEHEPICTVYLQYPEGTALDEPLVGLVGTLTQWVFDRGVAGQPGLMAAVISGAGPHQTLDNSALIERVTRELAACFKGWPAPRHGRVLREKRAVFASRVGVDRVRPGADTPVNGLYLAGDYTATGLPGTLEGAVRSGAKAAQRLTTGAGGR